MTKNPYVTMDLAFAIYHLNKTKQPSTLSALKKHKLLIGISTNTLKSLIQTLLDWGVIHIETRIGNNGTYDRHLVVAYPESVEGYGITRGFLSIDYKFNI